MKEKSEVFSKFKEYKSLVENQTYRKMKILRLDNDREFTSEEFKGLCREPGIKRELGTPYNPQQNGVTKRKKQTIMGVEKEMLIDEDLPMHLWAEATRTIVYVQNCTPHRVLDNKIPEEAFSRVKPEVSHMRIFGFPEYIHVPKEKRTKFDPSGRKGVFIGYGDTSKAYRIYFPGFKNIDITRDITFDEYSTYFISNRTPFQEVGEPEETRVSDM